VGAEFAGPDVSCKIDLSPLTQVAARICTTVRPLSAEIDRNAVPISNPIGMEDSSGMGRAEDRAQSTQPYFTPTECEHDVSAHVKDVAEEDVGDRASGTAILNWKLSSHPGDLQFEHLLEDEVYIENDKRSNSAFVRGCQDASALQRHFIRFYGKL
jgi:hypothetical protein